LTGSSVQRSIQRFVVRRDRLADDPRAPEGWARRSRCGVALVVALLAAPVLGVDDLHVVKPGETLWQIAANLTGSGSRWHEIYRANRDQIKDPSRLYPGQRLAIPDFATGTAGSSAAPTAQPDAAPD
jgi:nucleoid-associated protein YgaU